MNIQKINFNQNFGVKIGPKLQAEIDRKREELANLPKSKSHIKPSHFEARVNLIKSLFPTYKGSPVTAEITEADKDMGGWSMRKYYYCLTSEDGNFYKKFDRVNDGKSHFDRYSNLIDNLRLFEKEEKEVTLVSGLKPQSKQDSSREYKSNGRYGKFSNNRGQYSERTGRFSSSDRY